MKTTVPCKPQGGDGFTLLEMMVNLGLMLVVMLIVAKIAGHTSDTVSNNSGKLAAVEKSDSLRHFLQRDLGAVVRLESAEDALVCKASEGTWQLALRIPGPGGWQEIGYDWSKKDGTMSRWSTVDGKRVETVISTGITRFETRWLKDVSGDAAEGPQGWADGSEPPSVGNFTIETTRAREEGKRDAVRDRHVESTRVGFTLPVGGGVRQES